MSLRTSAYLAQSLDGFIARPDGELDWLDRANATVPPGQDCGYGAFFASVDVLVMGRATFDKVLTFADWPYGTTRVVVLARSDLAVPAALGQTVSVSSESPELLCARLAGEGFQHAYVDGGLTVQRFLRAGLLSELTLTTIPVLLGAGRPLFGALERDVSLEHLATVAYPFGFVQSRYRVLGAKEAEGQ